jgi:hypothetical protein
MLGMQVLRTLRKKTLQVLEQMLKLLMASWVQTRAVIHLVSRRNMIRIRAIAVMALHFQKYLCSAGVNSHEAAETLLINFAAFVLLPVTYSVIVTFLFVFLFNWDNYPPLCCMLCRRVPDCSCLFLAKIWVRGQDIQDGDLFRVSGVDAACKLLYVLNVSQREFSHVLK